jgi:dipeptidase E
MSDSRNGGHRRIVAAGAGRDGMDQPEICEAILELAGTDRPSVLYLGTATYDRPEPREGQTARLARLGCRIEELSVADTTPTFQSMAERVAGADVILASGGNTLFAVDRWKRLGIDRLLRDAMARGAVLCGGSAGAICWFDGGHSDSMDPRSYKRYELAPEPPGLSDDEITGWAYVRAPGLGFVPGLCCPHHDRTQNNGVPRAMMLRHPGETGIAIDHFAALVIDGDAYRVVAPDRPGSVSGDSIVADGRRRPGVWRLTVVSGRVEAKVVPAEGEVARILNAADAIVVDPRVATARASNPDDLP